MKLSIITRRGRYGSRIDRMLLSVINHSSKVVNSTTSFSYLNFFSLLRSLHERCRNHAIQHYIAVTILSMMTVATTMRRSGVFVTAFATLSSTTNTKRGVAMVAARAGTTFVSSALQQQQHTTSSSIMSSTSSFHPRTPFRPIHNFAQRRCQSAIAASTATTMEPSTLSMELQAKMDVTHPAYEVLEKDVVTEYGAYCTLYRHKKSGAELLSVAVDDDNKVFGITLRTPPEDSTGVPHILEHSVLCGSRKYTTKDPFVHLLKGSLQTFLNAFTYPDRTCYVVASQNEKDFYNLVNVYADAVYHPRAVSDPMVHAQEGWHLEIDDNNKLIYNGVV